MPIYTFRPEAVTNPQALAEVVGVRYLAADELTAENPVMELIWDHSDERTFNPALWLEADVEELTPYGEWESATGYRLTELKKAEKTGIVSNGERVGLLAEYVAGE